MRNVAVVTLALVTLGGLAGGLGGCGGSHRKAGLRLAEKGRPDEARAELERAIVDRPGDREALVALARLEKTTGRPGAALTAYAQAARLGVGGGVKAELADLLIARARAHEALGLRGRYADLAWAVELEPQRATELATELERAAIDRALAVWSAGDRGAAEKILATLPSPPKLPLLLERARVRRGGQAVADAVIEAALAKGAGDPGADLIDLRRRREVAPRTPATAREAASTGVRGPALDGLCAGGLGDDLDVCVGWLGEQAASSLRERPGPAWVVADGVIVPRPDATAARIARALARYLWTDAATFEDSAEVRAALDAAVSIPLEALPAWSRPLIGRLRGTIQAIPSSAGQGAPGFGALVLAWELARRGQPGGAEAALAAAEASSGPAPIYVLARLELGRLAGGGAGAGAGDDAARAKAPVGEPAAVAAARGRAQRDVVAGSLDRTPPLVVPARGLVDEACAADLAVADALGTFVDALVSGAGDAARDQALRAFLDTSVAIGCRGPLAARVLLAVGDPARARMAAEETLAVDETFVEAAALAADAAARANDAARAERHAERAFEWSTARGALGVRLVDAFLEAGAPVSALVTGRLALGLAEATERPALLRALARAARALGREGQARLLEADAGPVRVAPLVPALATDGLVASSPWSPAAAAIAVRAASGPARRALLETMLTRAATASAALRPAWLRAIAEAAVIDAPTLAARARIAAALADARAPE